MTEPRLEVREGGASADKGRAWAIRAMGLAAVALFTVGFAPVSIPAGGFAIACGVKALRILRAGEPVPGARLWAWSGLVVGAAALAFTLLLTWWWVLV